MGNPSLRLSEVLLLKWSRSYDLDGGYAHLSQKPFKNLRPGLGPTKIDQMICLFDLIIDSLHPSQQLFSYVGMGLPGLNQY